MVNSVLESDKSDPGRTRGLPSSHAEHCGWRCLGAEGDLTGEGGAAATLRV